MVLAIAIARPIFAMFVKVASSLLCWLLFICSVASITCGKIKEMLIMDLGSNLDGIEI